MTLPGFVTWTENGKTYKQVTAEYKRGVLAGYAVGYKLNTFVETGTCEGDTLEIMRNYSSHLYSIESDKAMFDKAMERFSGVDNVTVLFGDSGEVLPDILPELESPALFWLDAHGPNWIGPIVNELEAIYASGIKGVILIDDMDYITDTLPTHPDWKEESSEYGIVRLINVG